MFCIVSGLPPSATYQVLVVWALRQLTTVLLENVSLVGGVLRLDLVNVHSQNSSYVVLAPLIVHMDTYRSGSCRTG